MLKKNTLVLLFTLISIFSFSQKKTPSSSPKPEFNTKEAEAALLKALNKIRADNKIDLVEYNEVLGSAAAIQTTYMAKEGKADLSNSKGKHKTTQKRVRAVGGTNKAQEIVLATGIVKGKTYMTPEELAESAFYKWRVGKVPQSIIKNSEYLYASPSVTIDKEGKKVYISIVFGNYSSFNTGADKKKELPVPYTGKNKKLKSPEERTCNACKKFKDWEGLANGLYVENGKIFIKYASLKALSKFIRKSGDGLAVDIVQYAQYENPAYNIMNNNLNSKGILLKTVTKNKLYSKNKIKSVKKGNRTIKPTKLDVQLGELPKKITGAYELNLLIVQDGKLCKVIIPSKIEQGDQESNTPLGMLLMPDTAAYLKPPFKPSAENTLLSFSVPFEKNKSDYKETDLDPFLVALQEPDFLIEGLYITAYSSIEGDANANDKLQKKRAQSIIKALSKIQKQGVVTNVKTSDSWNLFQMETEDGEYDYLAKMPKAKAIQEINSKGLANALEPILSKERFAQIIMDVTYDITGTKEEKYSVSKFNQAMQKSDIKQGLKIQYFIGNQICTKKYSPEIQAKMNIPMTPQNSGLLNNRVVYRYKSNNNVVSEEDYDELQKVAALDPANNYVKFNSIYCLIAMDTAIGDSKVQNGIQKQIDALYKTEIPKKFVDALNIEWQFKLIEATDTSESSDAITQACIEKIKSFYDIKESSWQNNLKLAYVFARFKDYKYAAGLLAPFITQESVNENLLFAYASICAKMPELYNSKSFALALQKAEKANHNRYCNLFGAPNLTFQIFENQLVKEDYKKAGCSKQ